MGESCDQMCPQGRFGPGCIHTCNCRNKATCDPISGCCGCSSGFYGQSCELGKRLDTDECTSRKIWHLKKNGKTSQTLPN